MKIIKPKINIINKANKEMSKSVQEKFLHDMSYTEIYIHETPTTKNWCFEPLYRNAANGKILVWQIGFNDKKCRLIIKRGFIDGVIQTTTKLITTNNSNKTIQEQAFVEARHRYIDKYDNSYRPAGQLTSDLETPRPMLAKTYKEGMIKRWPVATQPKIDGIRALFYIRNNELILKSRSGKTNTIGFMDHIKEEIISFFKYLPLYTVVDSELYIHLTPHNIIRSIVLRTKNKHVRSREVNAYIFDIIEPDKLPFEKRYNILINAFKKYKEDYGEPKYLKIVPIYNAFSHTDILKYRNIFMKYNYEGLIIRKYAITYFKEGQKIIRNPTNIRKPTKKEINESIYKSNGRNNLLKYKKFIDEEAEIIDVIPCEENEMIIAMFKIKDIRGNEFLIRPHGTFKQREKWLKQKESLIGRQYKFKYFELSEYNKPLMPTGISFRDGE